MRWNIDGSHSTAEFSVRHLMITNVKGRFGTLSGTVDYDPEKPEASQIDVTIDTTSINTRDEKRDAHLRAARTSSTRRSSRRITFKSTKVKKTATTELHR